MPVSFVRLTRYLVRSRGDLAYSRPVFLFFFALRAHLDKTKRRTVLE